MMRYDKKEIFDEAMNATQDKGVHFIDDVVASVSCSRSTFYDMFPDGSDELDTIKDAINQNKIATKLEIRQKLKKGDKAAELIALYKLLATEDERRALSMQQIDHTTKGKEISIPPITWVGKNEDSQ